jgi:hypothetical protein
LVVVPANQASTSASNKPKTPLDSKTNYATAFFDSIDPTETLAASQALRGTLPVRKFELRCRLLAIASFIATARRHVWKWV